MARQEGGKPEEISVMETKRRIFQRRRKWPRISNTFEISREMESKNSLLDFRIFGSVLNGLRRINIILNLCGFQKWNW